MKRTTVLGLGVLALSLGCSGPEAPDVAVCQDLIHRLCLAPICPSAQNLVPPDSDCETVLLANTGCFKPTFQFTTPSRERVLSCRAPLLNQGDGRNDHPACTDVDATLACPDVTDFLEGVSP